jgi:hypothetical protein
MDNPAAAKTQEWESKLKGKTVTPEVCVVCPSCEGEADVVSGEAAAAGETSGYRAGHYGYVRLGGGPVECAY